MFTDQERKLLRTLIEKDYQLIESKKSDIVSLKRKRQLWDEIVKNFNSAGLSKRTLQELKKNWDNQKQRAKKFMDK